MTSTSATPKALRLEVWQQVATLTIQSKSGVLGPGFWTALPRALTQLGGARVLIIRGEQLFSAGLDLKAAIREHADEHPDQFTSRVQGMQAALDTLTTLPIPVIAAVHGWCIGAALELICAADLRLCSLHARFSLPEVKLGLTADLGGLERLPALIGLGRTAHLALTGEAINAQTAECWGLVTEVLETPDELFERARALADQLVLLPAQALEGTKRNLRSELPASERLARSVAWNAEHLDLSLLERALK